MEKDYIDEKLSNTLYVYKALAIVFVVMAHCVYEKGAVAKISALFGMFGVPMFLTVSGFFFNKEEKAADFWRKKTKSIVIPWLLWGIITFAIRMLTARELLGMIELFKWLLGNGNWLYFVPVLLSCFLLLRISTHKAWTIGLFVVFLFSNVATIFGWIFPYKYVTQYQNAFNWCGFFILGVWVRENLDKIKKIKFNLAHQIGLLILWVAFGVLYVVFFLHGTGLTWGLYLRFSV